MSKEEKQHQELRRLRRLNKAYQQKKSKEDNDDTTFINKYEIETKLAKQYMEVEENQNDNQFEEQ